MASKEVRSSQAISTMRDSSGVNIGFIALIKFQSNNFDN
jgi:hypothetical protein